MERMRRCAMGNGQSQCILCGEEFGFLSSSGTTCEDCRKVCFTHGLSCCYVATFYDVILFQSVCGKCSVDTVNSHQQSVWLCKICSENREVRIKW